VQHKNVRQHFAGSDIAGVFGWRRSSFGGLGGFLVPKFVKQTKIHSRLAHERNFHQLALVQTEPNDGGSWYRDSTENECRLLRQKQPRLDAASSVFQGRQVAEPL